MQLQDDIDQFEAIDLQVVAVSYDDVAILKSFAGKEGITFPLLSDKGSATIRAYGVHNMDGVPHPGTFLIDQEGVIRGKLFHEGYRERPPTEEIIQLVGPDGDQND